MLDTDTASYIIKGQPASVMARLSDMPPNQLCLSAITRAELLYGLKRLPQSPRLHLGVGQFLRLVATLPWPEDAAAHYAEIRHQLVTTGQTIGEMDMMIAAHAMAIGAVLVTNNTWHYERIAAPLTLVNWATV